MSGFKSIGFYSGYNPFLRLARNFFVPKFFGHQEIRAAELYASSSQSPFFKDVVSTENTTTRLTQVYLHWWLLEYHLVKAGHAMPLLSKRRLKNFIKLRQLIHLTELLIKTEHVQQYSNEYDSSIHDELRRTNLVLRHSLAAFFIHPLQIATLTSQDGDTEQKNQLESILSSTVVHLEPAHAGRLADYVQRSIEEDNLQSYTAKIKSVSPDAPIIL